MKKNLVLMMVRSLTFSASALVWDVSYEGNVLPENDIITWGKSGEACTLGVDDGIDYLSFSTVSDQKSYIFSSSTGFWNPDFSTGVIVESRIRISGDTKQTGGINIGDGSAGCGFNFYVTNSTDLLSIKKSDGSGNAYVPIGGDANMWHTYKIVALGNSWELFIDGTSVWKDSLYGPNGRYIFIGDNKTSASENMQADYDYIRYLNVVPEPATIVLLGLAFLLKGFKRCS